MAKTCTRSLSFVVTAVGREDTRYTVGIHKEAANMRAEAIRHAIRIGGTCFQYDEDGFIDRIWPPK